MARAVAGIGTVRRARNATHDKPVGLVERSVVATLRRRGAHVHAVARLKVLEGEVAGVEVDDHEVASRLVERRAHRAVHRLDASRCVRPRHRVRAVNGLGDEVLRAVDLVVPAVDGGVELDLVVFVVRQVRAAGHGVFDINLVIPWPALSHAVDGDSRQGESAKRCADTCNGKS